jgi:hypothetical protein
MFGQSKAAKHFPQDFDTVAKLNRTPCALRATLLFYEGLRGCACERVDPIISSLRMIRTRTSYSFTHLSHPRSRLPTLAHADMCVRPRRLATSHKREGSLLKSPTSLAIPGPAVPAAPDRTGWHVCESPPVHFQSH